MCKRPDVFYSFEICSNVATHVIPLSQNKHLTWRTEGL